MHEYGPTESIVTIVNEEAKKHGAKRVKKVNLVIGEHTGFIGESISMYFDVIAKGTLASGAELVMRYIPAEFKCTSCAALFVHEPGNFACPACGSAGSPTDKGSEFYVESIEV